MKKLEKMIENVSQREALLRIARKPWCKGQIWDDIHEIIEELEKQWQTLQ